MNAHSPLDTFPNVVEDQLKPIDAAALFDVDGRLLGIGSLRLEMSRNGEVSDINMVVPIDLLPPILDDLLTRGQAATPPRPWLGAFSADSDGKVVVMSVA